MQIITIDKPFLDLSMKLGEGLIWDHESQQLGWVDILGKRVFLYSAENQELKFFETPTDVGSVVFIKNTQLLLATKYGFSILETQSGRVNDFLRVQDNNDFRFNDGKCDPVGRFWAGTMSYCNEERVGKLYCLEPNRKIQTKLVNLTIPNGLVWTKDNRYMYFVDSFPRTLTRYDYDIVSGVIKNPKIIIKFSKYEGTPDGMTMDNEGMLWIAMWGKGKVIRINPENLQIDEEVHIEDNSLVTSCAIGGVNLDELYISTAKNLNHDSKDHSGNIFMLKLPRPLGVPTKRFLGEIIV